MGGPCPPGLEVGQGHGGPRQGRAVWGGRARGEVGVVVGEQLSLEPGVILREGARRGGLWFTVGRAAKRETLG